MTSAAGQPLFAYGGERHGGRAASEQDAKERRVRRPFPGADQETRRDGDEHGRQERQSSPDHGVAGHFRAQVDLGAGLEHEHREPKRGEDGEGLGAGVDQM